METNEIINLIGNLFNFIRNIFIKGNLFSGFAAAIVIYIFTRRLLKEKLIETHITKKLNEIQDANTEVRIKSEKLFDKYFLLGDISILSKEVLEEVLKDIKKLSLISEKASSSITTIIILLKLTLMRAHKGFDKTQETFIFKIDFYNFIIEILESVNYYSTEVVEIPKSVKNIKKETIAKKLKKYVKNSEINSFKHFKLGVDKSVDSAYFLLFIDAVIRSKIIYLMLCALDKNRSPKNLAKMLYCHNIYAPSILENDDSGLLGEGDKIYLIGFYISSTLKEIKLYYSDPSTANTFDFNIFKKHIEKYKDIWIENSNFSFSKGRVIPMKNENFFTLEYKREYLEELFKKNKKAIKRKIKVDKFK